jgi:hypothetical protein
MYACKLNFLCVFLDAVRVTSQPASIFMWACVTYPSSQKCAYTPLRRLSDGACFHAPSPPLPTLSWCVSRTHVRFRNVRCLSRVTTLTASSWEVQIAQETLRVTHSEAVRGKELRRTQMCWNFSQCMKIEVFTAVRRMLLFFLVLGSCRLAGRCHRFGEKYCFHLQDWSDDAGKWRDLYSLPFLQPYINPSTSQHRHFSLEDGNNISLRNDGIYLRVYTAPKPKITTIPNQVIFPS